VPDLVLLNLKLSRVNGYSVCQALKADPRTRRTPIIIVSSMGVREMAKATGMEADDYLAKPFGMEELRSRVRMALLRRGGNGGRGNGGQ
jgi:DNA-binding response OmpR family regulator